MENRIKILGAAVLLVSLALPMATCAHYVDAAGDRVEVEDRLHPPAGVTEVVENQYALGHFDWTDWSSWSRLFAFVWPALTLAALARWRRGRVALAVRIAELPLLAGSFWLVGFISSFLVDRAYGAWVAFAGLGLYAVGALWSDVLAIRRWRRRRSERGARAR